MESRYSRQELFQPIGPEGQKKIRRKHVLIIGAGALGAGGAEILARAGIGKLTIVDRDYVEWSNLQRQQLYTEQDARERLPKAVAARRRLQAVNSEVEIACHVMDVNPESVEALTDGVDLIMDATDNFDTRLLINDIAHKTRIPWIYGACVGSYGSVYTVLPGKTPCLYCLLDTVPLGGATCDTVGVIASVVQMVISCQTAEALKLLVEDDGALHRKWIAFDLWKNQYAAIGVDRMKKRDCPTCGENPTYPYLNEAKHPKTAILCGRDTVQIRPPAPVAYHLEELADRLAKWGEVQQNPYLVSFRADGHRIVVFRDGRVLVHGTRDIRQAKSLYHRFLG